MRARRFRIAASAAVLGLLVAPQMAQSKIVRIEIAKVEPADAAVQERTLLRADAVFLVKQAQDEGIRLAP